jgi:hypothetical protein
LHFLKNDGGMLISYNAFIFFLSWPLKSDDCRVLWWFCCWSFPSLQLPEPRKASTCLTSTLLQPLAGATKSGVRTSFFRRCHAPNTAGVYATRVVLARALLQRVTLSLNQKIFRWGLLACGPSGLLVTYSCGAATWKQVETCPCVCG